MVPHTIVSVVDDDASVRESLPDLLGELGFEARSFASAEEFLASDAVRHTRCLIIDIALPGMSGPKLTRELNRRGQRMSTIFITGHGDDGIRARLIQQGATECLFKPFTDDEVRAALDAALPGRDSR